MRRRLDTELVRRRLVPTTEEALAVIAARSVMVSGSPASSPGTLVADGDPITILPRRRFVSRGGEKLDAALDRFAVRRRRPARPRRRRRPPAGSPTACSSAGAARSWRSTSGTGQLDWRLRDDPRVMVLERTNVRDLEPGDPSGRPDLVVADLSFISLPPSPRRLAAPGAGRRTAVLLVKPQFEAGRGRARRTGVVPDPAVWERAVRAVREACRAAGGVRDGGDGLAVLRGGRRQRRVPRSTPVSRTTRRPRSRARGRRRRRAAGGVRGAR